jgi:hypothetical protein
MKQKIERTLTLHPTGKKGVNIEKQKYDFFRDAIVDRLRRDELTFTDLAESIRAQLGGSFKGSVGWYVEAVKLDLEARRIIARVDGSKPQRYRLMILDLTANRE